MIRTFRDLLFPPICIYCKESCTKPYLCDACWELSALLNPEERCPHCFGAVEAPSLCSRCRKKPYLLFPRAALFDIHAPIRRLFHSEENYEALAGLALVQWTKLGWKDPDLIIPIPPKRTEIARFFARHLDRPCPNLIYRKAWPIDQERWYVREELIEEGDTVLLFDAGCSLRQLQLASHAILEAFPKKVSVLSLSA